MAPRVTAEIDSQYMFDWTKWPVPEMPPIPKWKGPWNTDVSNYKVDTDRTYKLREYNIPIKTGAGQAPWNGSTYGRPISLYNDKGPKTAVWDLSKPIVWNWFSPTFPVTRVALPEHVRREGDPVGSSDMHSYLVDPANKIITEMILVRKSLANLLQTFFQTEWTVGYAGGGPGIYRWDISKPYNADGQPKGGVVAAAVPQLPMVVGWEEIQAGVIDHCMFGVLPNYSKEVTGWARGSDGSSIGHPVRAGEILRLKKEKLSTYLPGTPEHIIATALVKYGWFQGDRNGPDTGVGEGHFPLTMDRRWAQGDGKIPRLADMKLSLVDFEVVTP